jgi:hypothetical protein
MGKATPFWVIICEEYHGWDGLVNEIIVFQKLRLSPWLAQDHEKTGGTGFLPELGHPGAGALRKICLLPGKNFFLHPKRRE